LRNAKGRLEKLEGEIQAVVDQAAAEHELRLVIGQFEEFAQRVSEGLHEGDWTTRREIITPKKSRRKTRVSDNPNVTPQVRGSWGRA